MVRCIKTNRWTKELELINFSRFHQEVSCFTARLHPSDWKAKTSTLSSAGAQKKEHQLQISRSASGLPLITRQFTYPARVSVSSYVKED